MAPDMFTLFLRHWYVNPGSPTAVNVTLPPVQKLVAPLAEILTAGNGLMVTTFAADDVDPHEFVTFTL